MMSKCIQACLLLSLASASTHCMTVRSLSISQVPRAAERHQTVSASADSPVVLLIPFNTDYLSEAHDRFVSQCRNGSIEGVLTKHETTDYFLGLVFVQRVHLQGYCVPKMASASQTKRKRKG